MATVPVEDTLAVGGKITAAWGNSDIRDAINFLLAPPRALAYQGTATTSFTSAVFAVVGMDAETFDTDAMHSTSVNNSRLTIVTTGMYLIVGSLGFAANATGYRQAGIYKNGVLAQRAIVMAASAGTTVVPIHGMLSLTAGDYVELAGAQNSGGALTSVASADSTFISATWIASS